jgi:hypothetical protein
VLLLPAVLPQPQQQQQLQPTLLL